MKRYDGSIQSANIPAKGTLSSLKVETDYGIYRCMIIAVNFVDDEENFTFENPQVTYDAIILGGRKEGQILTNVRAMNHLGGQYNYHERIFRKATDDFSGNKKKLIKEQKGDIVYISFVNGDTSLPIILGAGVSPLDKDETGATKEDGAILKQEFNGVNQFINKEGEFELIRKGGVYKEDAHYFVPSDRVGEETDAVEKPEFDFLSKIQMKEKLFIIEDPKSKLTLDLENENFKAEIGEKKTLLEIDGKSDAVFIKTSTGTLITMEGESGEIILDSDGGTNKITIKKSGEIEIMAATKVKINSPLVDVGENAAYSVTLFENLLTEFANHTHHYINVNVPSVSGPPVAPLISLVGSVSVKSKD
ncbi:MAG: hypothetical protein MOGMAGMI_00396 [Candidatus Omnitrophica bacterium]|nr:hypothetical protein [Candidatus Omnitrophota bacterium]